MMIKLLNGYMTKNRGKFLVMIFAVVMCVTVMFANKVAKNSQTDYVVKETKKQMADYQAKLINGTKEDFDIIKNDPNTKNVIMSKYYGDIRTEKDFYKLESYNKDSFKQLKNTIVKGRYPEKENELIIDTSFFELLESGGKIKLGSDGKFENTYVDLRFIKEYQNEKGEEQILDETRKFKVVGVYDITEMMKRYNEEGFSAYVYENFDYPNTALTYNGYINLKSGFHEYEDKISSLQKKLKLTFIDSALIINEDRAMAIAENSASLTRLDQIDKGVLIAAFFIIFNVFNIMAKEMIQEIGLLRVVGMSKKQSLKFFLMKILIILVIGSIVGFSLGYIISIFMIRYMNFDPSMLIDPRKAPVLITAKSITNAIITTIIILILSTIIPILATITSYPIDMLLGKIKSNFKTVDELLSKLSIYRKIKGRTINNTKKNTANSRNKKNIIKSFFSKHMKMNLAIKNSKRNLTYIFTTAIIVGMAGLNVVGIFTSEKSDLLEHNPLLLKLGDYDIDLNYTGSDSLIEKGISKEVVKNVENIDGVESIYAVKRREAFSRLNTKDLSETTKTIVSLKERDRYIDFRFDLVSFDGDAFKNILNDYEGIIEEGRVCRPNSEVIEAVVYNKIEGQRNKLELVNEKYKLGDEIEIKLATQDNGKFEYKTVKLKIVGFLGPEWGGLREGLSAFPDIVINSSDYERVTGDSTYDEVKLKVNPQQLEDVKTKMNHLIENNESIKYDDRDSIEEEINQVRWIGIVRELFNSVLFAFSALLNIFFSIVASIEIRKKEFGTMRAIGLSIKDLKGILLREGLVYGIVSSFFGVLFIFYDGVKLSNILRKGAEFKHITYNDTWYIIPEIPTLLFILITISICVLAVTFTFRQLNKNIVEQIRDI
jgi:ABC-type lipoprotein release transport system permease subunit